MEHNMGVTDDEIPQNLAQKFAGAQQLFTSCITLQYVTFVQTSSFRRRNSLRASYRRLDSGEIIFEGDGVLHCDSWSEL